MQIKKYQKSSKARTGIKLGRKVRKRVQRGKSDGSRGEEAGIETLVMNEESEARLNAYILERVKAL